ncbi:MAG: hypothetical protein IPN32_35120 [Deltaproteobacteria bacterium]|nr:hypothetical protein [Deltaproteobacteria bacterium]
MAAASAAGALAPALVGARSVALRGAAVEAVGGFAAAVLLAVPEVLVAAGP